MLGWCACPLGAYGRIEHLNIRFGEPPLAGKARTERVVLGQIVSFPADDVDELNSLLRFKSIRRSSRRSVYTELKAAKHPL
jgi:hypothetical protein